MFAESLERHLATSMADKIRSLPDDDALEQIVETVQHAGAGDAPFALVLGSGFSHGLVPTAIELVTESLPLWMKALRDNASFDSMLKLAADQRMEIARGFWLQFVERNARRGLVLPLDPETGLPQVNADAYKAAFDPEFSGAVGEPAQARKFQRALMRLDQTRLNAAHFLLASLLGVQPGRSRQSNLFKARAAFSRLILTTNFDPFLQTALQSVNRLYFMSDTPELGVSDDVLDDHTDAIHLVYLHGSIHRRSQAATDEDIKALKEKNARILAPVLKRHGVIVLGYSGWDDAIVDALAACDRFDHRLYWCGREADPLAKGAFGPRVPDILRKPSALYVKIGSAGNFMAQLCNRLVEGLPRLLGNPIGQLREMLETIDLKELGSLAAPVMASSQSQQVLDGHSNPDAIVKAQHLAIARLAQAERAFLNPVDEFPPAAEEATKPDRRRKAKTAAGAKSQVRRLLSESQAAVALGNYGESFKLLTQALDLDGLQDAEQAKVLLNRGIAHYFLGKTDDAIADWSKVIDLPLAPLEEKAWAVYNRGLAWNEKGDTDKALVDYTRVIEQLPGAPVEPVAYALVNRGNMWDQKGDADKELADYTRVAEQLPGASIEQVTKALVNRGLTWSKKGDMDKELADYTRVIEQLPDAPVDQVARALVNRGNARRQKGEAENALADYTRVIEQLPGAPVDQVARALISRGVLWGQKGDTRRELADYERVIENLPGASVEHVAGALAARGWMSYQKKAYSSFLADTEAALKKLPLLNYAAFNLGLALLTLGRDADALAAYRKAGEQFPDEIQAQGLADLHEAQKTWLSKERAETAIRLLESLKRQNQKDAVTK